MSTTRVLDMIEQETARALAEKRYEDALDLTQQSLRIMREDNRREMARIDRRIADHLRNARPTR